MCRKQMVWGYCMITFGIGILVGRWMDSWFWGGVFGLLLMGIGCAMLNRR